MRTDVDTRRDGAPLGERWYLAETLRHLRDLPRGHQDTLLAAAAERIDAAASHDYEQLCAAFGRPVDFAATLRFEHGIPAEPRRGFARWRAQPWRRRIGIVVPTVVVLAAIVSGVLTWRWWVNWQVSGLAIDGRQVAYSDGTFRGIHDVSDSLDGQVGVTYAPTKQLRVSLLFTAQRDVRITRVEWPNARESLIKVDHVALGSGLTVDHLRPFRPFSFAHDVNGVNVVFYFRFGDCQWFSTGVTTSWDHVRVTYEALGRTRHQDVLMRFALAVVSPPDSACPARRLT